MAKVDAYTNEQGEVSFKNPTTGEYVWVPAENAAKAAGQGYLPETADQHQKRLEMQRLDESNLEAFGYAAARGATLGLSDQVMRKLDPLRADRAQKLAEANPNVSLGGEIVGGVASAVVPGGPLAKIGALGAKAAGAGKTAQVLGRSLVEGAALGAGSEVSEAALQDRGVRGGELAKRALSSAAVGGLTSVGLLGAGKVISKVTQKVAKQTPLSRGIRALQDSAGAADDIADPVLKRKLLMDELTQSRNVATGLKANIRKGVAGEGEAELLSRMETHVKGLADDVRLLDKQQLALDPLASKVSAKTTTKTTTEGVKRAADDQIGAAAKAVGAMDDDAFAALSREHERLSTYYDDIIGADEHLRGFVRAQVKAGDKVAENSRLLRSWAEQEKHFVQAKREGMEKALTAYRMGKFKTQGEMLQAAGVTRTVREKTTEKMITPAKRASEILESRDLRRLASRPESLINSEFANRLAEGTVRGQVATGITSHSVWGASLLGYIIGDATGAMAGFVGRRFLSPVIESVGGKVIAALGVGARSGAGAIVRGAGLAASKMTAKALEGARETTAATINAPDRVASEAKEGYLAAGLEEVEATALAQYQGGRTAFLREEAQRTRGDHEAWRDALVTAEEPRRITKAISKGRLSRQQWSALKHMSPDIAAVLTVSAKAALANSDGLKMSQIAQLELMAGERAKTYRRTMSFQSMFAGGQDAQSDSGQQPTRPFPVKGAAAAATSTQAMRADLTGG